MVDTSNLSARFAALREKHDTRVASDSKQATPLWVFLYIVSKTSEARLDYHAGAKSLWDYLQPVEFPPEYHLETSRYDVPALFSSWGMSELAMLITGYRGWVSGSGLEVPLVKVRRAERAIMITMIKEVMPRLYGVITEEES